MFSVLLRYELNVDVLNRFNRRFRQYIGTHVPIGQSALVR